MNSIDKVVDQLLSGDVLGLMSRDKRMLTRGRLTDFIVGRVFSNRFRKTSPSETTKQEIVDRIRRSVRQNQPLHFTIPTGGYKKWQFQGALQVNWAEVFHLKYMFNYLRPIADNYSPGVKLSYFSNSWLIQAISHYPPSDLDEYARSFRVLIRSLKKYAPANLSLVYNEVSDQKDERVLMERILRNRSDVEVAFDKLTQEKKELKLAASERNIRWDILEATRKLSAKERRRLIYEGVIIHDCLLAGGWNTDLDYLFNENRIAIIHRRTDDSFLSLATAHGAQVQFWVGQGVLEKRGEDYCPRVLSFLQYQNVLPRLVVKKSTLFPKQLVNLQTIAVLK